MTEQNIVQNIIFKLGQSQDQRRALELGPHFADVDERTSEDLLDVARELAKKVKYWSLDPQGMLTASGDWAPFVAMIPKATAAKVLASQTGDVTPHLALLLAFLELYKIPQEIINRITGRHLEFFYREVLRLRKKSAIPHRVHLLLELKKNAESVSIHPLKDLFSAGKDPSGVELLYDPLRETVINVARVVSLRSLFVDNTGHGVVRYAPVANSSDGLGGTLPETDPKWSGFGHTTLPQAEVGFAISSPVLRVKEGLRKICLELTLKDAKTAKLENGSLAGAFEVFLTGEKGWLGPYDFSPTLEHGVTLCFDCTLGEKDGAVVDYSSKTHGYAYFTDAPVLHVLLKENGNKIGYNDLRNVALDKASLSVSVSNITSLALENDAGVLDAKKPFLPFGSQPTKGARFSVGCVEALSKKLSELGVSVIWKDVPASGFKEHYLHYGIPIDNNSEVVNSNAYFTAGVTFRDAGSEEYHVKSQVLFPVGMGGSDISYTFHPGIPPSSRETKKDHLKEGMMIHALSRIGTNWAAREAQKRISEKPVYRPFRESSPVAKEGYLSFSLEKGFLHSTYRQKYVENILAAAIQRQSPVILNEPYTPTIQSISLSYTAHADDVVLSSEEVSEFANTDLQFFHISYFGQMREHGYQRRQFDFLTDKDVRLLPGYENEGELLIGLSSLSGRESVSMLFQVAEGSADPDLDRAEIQWSVLCDNHWKPLGTRDVVHDTTNQLLTSGTITFIIPSEATTANTILPAGLLWIKGGIRQQVTAACQLVDVASNAVEVLLLERRDESQVVPASLEKGKISKLLNGHAAVKTVAQPYASFGGRAPETDASFSTRVSERLRHKNRCITPWDYERIVLEDFPSVHQVKCVPHARQGSWLAPGHVLIAVVPDLRNKNSPYSLQPKVDSNTISTIKDRVLARTGSQVEVEVTNPRYRRVQVEFKVKFLAGYEFNYYSGELNKKVIQFLSPWAFDTGKDPVFGGRIYKSVILDFIEEVEQVDYVTDFKMFWFPDVTGTRVGDVNEVQPGTPDSILVSAESHGIMEAP